MPRNLLLVDDEAPSRDALARALMAHGFDVRTAFDAHEATQLIGQQAPDVILLDIDLPHVPGDSLATFLHLRYPRVRIIFISGQYDMIDPQRFGTDSAYFRKPIDMDALLDALQGHDRAGTGTR